MICEFCSISMNELYISNKKYNICDRCKILKKVDIPNYNDEYNRYKNHIVDNDYMNYMTKIYEDIKPFLNDGNILDFGCGQRKALKEIISDRNVISYDKYFYDDLNYKQYKYDNIVMVEVIEHITNVKEVLDELYDLLKDNGNLIILTNLHNGNFDNWWYLRDITHVSFFDQETFKVIEDIYNFKEINLKNNIIVLKK